jgi:hypothetical protein
MQTDEKSLSAEEKIKNLLESEREKQKELEQKKSEFEKKKKELEELEAKRKKEISAAKEEVDEQIEELAFEEQKRFEELEEIRRRREAEAATSLEETVEEEEARQRPAQGPRQRPYGDVMQEIMQGTPGVYDITNYNVMNRLERIAREASEQSLDQTDRNFVELVQTHALRMQANTFYREKDTSEYMKRELEKIDQINRALKERDKPFNYNP